MNLCEIHLGKWFLFIGFAISSVMFLFVLTIGIKPYFYKKLSFESTGTGFKVIKEYGPVHTLFYIYVGVFFAIAFAAIFYSLIKKRQVSNYIVKLLFLPEIIAFIGYMLNPLLKLGVELLPIAYVFAQFIYILIVQRMSHYKVSEMVISSMIQTGETGFISLDSDYHYLGANETAKRIIPEIEELSIDQMIKDVPELKKTVVHWVEHFEEDSKNSKNIIVRRDPENEENNRYYLVNTHYLYDGKKKCGYQIFLTDDTKNQKYIELLDRYKSELEEEVEEKTQHIVEMHNNLILSMATMVESRDNSTGGHIKRTSEGVRILIGEMKDDDSFELAPILTKNFCKNIIKAAPMHDLGKVAVDDAILRKPGRFTPEEYDIMKTHAAEGARIVHEILKDTDDEEFKIIAENVAHYHHERMDGSGYPEGLKGDEIPLEARIMAIADVYDALVSKRVYKDKMSFEEADKIMMESFGKHFDKRLEKYYISARPKLEAYYGPLDN
ncbi:MAG: HD domain-containing protein [Eubacterium sp.]|nr:HD domain-containing protein [Eubacterium sp.]